MKSKLAVLTLGLALFLSNAHLAMAQNPVNVGNKICPVSGEKIPTPGEEGAMGEPVQFVYNGKVYNLCCKACAKDFQKDPEKYSKIAEEEARKSRELIDGHEIHNHNNS